MTIATAPHAAAAGGRRGRHQPVVPVAASFADRLNRLFASIYPPGRGPYTNKELFRWAISNGTALSAPYISQLRSGCRARPSQQTLRALADFFGISSAYFTDQDPEYTRMLITELDWLDASRDPDVRRLTSLILDLPDDAQNAILNYLVPWGGPGQFADWIS